MKCLVISDLHGSTIASLKVHQLMETHAFDLILCCGDVLYHGPRNGVSEDYDPKQVIHDLSPYAKRIIAVKGNCDGEVDQMVLPFHIDSFNNTLWFNHHFLWMTHGHHDTPETCNKYLTNGDIFLYGHVHIPCGYTTKDGIHILNPGSMTFPKEGHPKTYAILDDDGFTIYTLDDQPYMIHHWTDSDDAH